MGEDGVKTFHGAEGYYLGTWKLGVRGHDFGSVRDYIDVRQCKRTGDFAKKCGFLVIRFNQRQLNLRSPYLQGQGGESGARADVEDVSQVVSGQWSVIGGFHAWREQVAGQK